MEPAAAAAAAPASAAVAMLALLGTIQGTLRECARRQRKEAFLECDKKTIHVSGAGGTICVLGTEASGAGCCHRIPMLYLPAYKHERLPQD
eukprot:1148682-Pelagomonas_calceolata.AAC.19